MIFVTVGAQMPFDRLIHAVDAWAREHDRDDCFAQVGPTKAPPTHIRWERFLEPEDFRQAVASCSAIVAHAGMGSIITALQYSKPILVMPRRGDLRETRNDHQVATAERFASMGKLAVARDEHELPGKLDALQDMQATLPISDHASDELLGALRSFLQDEKIPGTSGQRTGSGHREGQA